MNVQLDWKSFGTNAQPSELIHIFRSNQFELKLMSDLHDFTFLVGGIVFPSFSAFACKSSSLKEVINLDFELWFK